MKAYRPSWRIAQSLILATALLSGCGDSGNGTTSTTITISAPAIVSPSGANVNDRPRLVVLNVTVSDGSGPTYSFQVATDESFANIVAQVSGVIENTSGETSWKVDESLDGGQHFWRARASAGGTDGPFSVIARFTVMGDAGGGGGGGDGGSGGGGSGGRDVLFDALTDRTTRAIQRGGGRFTPQGWQVLTRRDFLRYEVEPISSGYVQWDMTGLRPENVDITNHMVLGMWDPTEGPYRDNAFRVHVQKLHPPQHNPPFMRVRWISRGDVFEEGANFLRWDPNQVYTWRLEWGPVNDDSFFAFLYLDGRLMILLEYFPDYRLTKHYIELGIAARQESIVNAVYSNVHIGEILGLLPLP